MVCVSVKEVQPLVQPFGSVLVLSRPAPANHVSTNAVLRSGESRPTDPRAGVQILLGAPQKSPCSTRDFALRVLTSGERRAARCNLWCNLSRRTPPAGGWPGANSQFPSLPTPLPREDLLDGWLAPARPGGSQPLLLLASAAPPSRGLESADDHALDDLWAIPPRAAWCLVAVKRLRVTSW